MEENSSSSRKFEENKDPCSIFLKKEPDQFSRINKIFFSKRNAFIYDDLSERIRVRFIYIYFFLSFSKRRGTLKIGDTIFSTEPIRIEYQSEPMKRAEFSTGKRKEREARCIDGYERGDKSSIKNSRWRNKPDRKRSAERGAVLLPW